MKLIDLLVQELPKRGGWPKDADYGAQDNDGSCDIKFGAGEATIKYDARGVWVNDESDDWRIDTRESFIRDLHVLAIDADTAIITRDQYEAALAAAQQPVWNGEGLPPVGCECELVNFYGEDFPEFVGDAGEKVRIIGNGFTNGCPVAFYEADGGRGSVLAYAVESCFRPIRTEAERKRSDICDKIYGAMTNAERKENRSDMAEAIYDAIAAGKIPGVKLEVTP